ncbi:MAG: DUF5320 domain-containing protein [Nanoarchaeota archaeon]|nr:DUF5320 domain-containing protein [Nanoarchaeota archaeon]
MGFGRLTGRGLGPCSRGLRQCFGRGFGFRYTEPLNLSKEEEKKVLEAELKDMELERKEIEKRLKEMK